MIKAIAQETPMGCAIACIASILNKSQSSIIKDSGLNVEKSWNHGYYCGEIVRILKNNGRRYKFSKVTEKTKHLIDKDRSIVFVKGKNERVGHYLVRDKLNNRWMESWINFPKMNPAKAGFVKKLPDTPRWVIYEGGRNP
ncbi:hypothetical protein COU61_02665 [Candidatus Pacearchaeota archaeon CG10_big_fil_rev_8_21_14_0_10_35_13]|nr:MAG: hypothetical protein COU61_02665 [Candidatus Pacearchaeota archaeon CG10_big_fil_rev_8_21_14_0_10_35_13]